MNNPQFAVVQQYAVCRMQYRCEAASVEGFIQQLAVSYVGNGYYFYVKGRIPPGKDPRAVDEKLVRRYGIDISKWARARRKRAGLANMQYLRHERTFVLLATHGQHAFFEHEAATIRDVRRTPIKFSGYSVSHRGGHPHVRIERETYLALKAHLVELSGRRSVAELERELRRIPFEPYAPVRRQLFNILRAMNRDRRTRGAITVPMSALRLNRRIVTVFDERELQNASVKGGSPMRSGYLMNASDSTAGSPTHARRVYGCER